MKELDALYDWLFDLKEIRNSYGKSGIKQVYQSDLDLGMKLYLELRKKMNEINKKYVTIERSYLVRLERADDKNWEGWE